MKENYEENHLVPTKFEKILSDLQKILDINDSELQENATEHFITDRLAELQIESPAKQPSISLVSNRTEENFINPETEIKRSWLVDSFNINDSQVYNYLLNNMSNFYKKWNKPDIRSIVGYSIIYALGSYFGNYLSTSETNKNNVDFYTNHTSSNSNTINLEELKGKNLAVCAEKAAVAHNYLKFLGADSHLIFSNNCSLDNSSDGHAFIVISSENGKFIFDPTNPIITSDDSDRISSISPALYKISEDDYSHLIKRDGHQITIEHTNQKRCDAKIVSLPPEKRIYG